MLAWQFAKPSINNTDSSNRGYLQNQPNKNNTIMHAWQFANLVYETHNNADSQSWQFGKTIVENTQ